MGALPAFGQANRLTPGRIATTVLPQVVQRTLFSGAEGFFLNVPEGAVHVEFSLTTLPPEANVNLFVRFEQDVERAPDGSIVSDFRSENPGGDETIVITELSAPPLAEGRYFVAFEVGFRNPQTFAFLTVALELSPGASNLDVIVSDDFSAANLNGWERNFPAPEPFVSGASLGSEDSALANRRDPRNRNRTLQLTAMGGDAFVMPTRYLGKISLLGPDARLEFDMRLSSNDPALRTLQVRVLSGLTTYRRVLDAPNNRYRRFIVPLGEEGWQRLGGSETFAEVMDNVLRIEITADFSGPDVIAFLDNVLLLGKTEPPAAPTISDFERDMDGWISNFPRAPFLAPRIAGATTAIVRPRIDLLQVNGNPGGHVLLTDNDDRSRDYLIAPDKFLGNLLELGSDARIAFDRRHVSPGGATRSVEVRIIGFGGAFAWLGPPPPEEWLHYEARLREQEWARLAGNCTFDEILRAVQRIEISLDETPGKEEAFLDNVAIVVPPPVIPQLTGRPQSLVFNAVSDGARPMPRMVELTANVDDLEWIAASSVGAPWIELPQARGVAPATLIVGVNPAGLAPGIHRGAVEVAWIGSTNPVRIDVTLTVSSATSPFISEGGVVSAATFTPNDQPGGELTGGMFFAIFGERLSNRTEQAGTVPFPSQMGGTVTTIGGIVAPLVFVSGLQIVGVVPQTLTHDPAAGQAVQTVTSADVIVRRDGESSPPIRVRLAPVNPQLFSQDQTGSGPGAVLNFVGQGNVQLNAFDNPARPRQTVSIFGSGLGPTRIPILDGFPATSVNPVTGAVRVLIGGREAQVLFAGLSPNSPHLYQVNANVPPDSSVGCETPVEVFIDGVASNVVTMAVTPNAEPCR